MLCLQRPLGLGKIGDKEIGVIDVFVGTLTLLIALYSAFGPAQIAASIQVRHASCCSSLSPTIWVAWNRWNGADGRGLGWFCLFVAITCVPIFVQTLLNSARQLLGTLARHLLGVLGRSMVSVFPDTRPWAGGTRHSSQVVLCTAQGIYTGWIPGYLLVTGPDAADSIWERHPNRLAAGLPAPGRSHALMAEHEICPCTTTSAVIVGHSVK